MPNVFTWILAVYGIAFLLSDAKILSDWIPVRPILKRLRFFKDLLECYFCMGIWISAALWVGLTWPNFLKLDAVIYLPAGAAGAYLLDLVVHYIETRILMTSLEGISPEEDE